MRSRTGPRPPLPPWPPTTPATDKTAKPSPPAADRLPPARRRLVWPAAIIVIVAVLAFAAWRAFFSPVTVSLAPVQSNVREQVFGLGVVGARIESNLGFKVAGVLSALDADQGDRVRAGQILARLDARDIEAQVAVAAANVAAARANIAKADADVASTTASLANASRISARDARLVGSGLVSAEEAETDRAAARIAAANAAVARSEVAQAEAALQSAQAQQAFEEATLANYTLTSPYEAWVISRNLELGSGVNPGQSVFTLVKAGTHWAPASVDAALAGRRRGFEGLGHHPAPSDDRQIAALGQDKTAIERQGFAIVFDRFFCGPVEASRLEKHDRVGVTDRGQQQAVSAPRRRG